MHKITPCNEVVKRAYLSWLEQAKGRSEPTVSHAAAVLERFDDFNERKPFQRFKRDQAVRYKAHLATLKNGSTGAPLAASTIRSSPAL